MGANGLSGIGRRHQDSRPSAGLSCARTLTMPTALIFRSKPRRLNGSSRPNVVPRRSHGTARKRPSATVNLQAETICRMAALLARPRMKVPVSIVITFTR